MLHLADIDYLAFRGDSLWHRASVLSKILFTVIVIFAVVLTGELLPLVLTLAGLDTKSKKEIIRLLWKFNREFGTTMVMTNHDVNLVPLIADSVCVISDGVIRLHGSPREVFARLDILRQANLEPPLLMELFADLARDGVPVDVPLTLEEARRQLLPLLKSCSICAPNRNEGEKKIATGCING